MEKINGEIFYVHFIYENEIEWHHSLKEAVNYHIDHLFQAFPYIEMHRCLSLNELQCIVQCLKKHEASNLSANAPEIAVPTANVK